MLSGQRQRQDTGQTRERGERTLVHPDSPDTGPDLDEEPHWAVAGGQ